MVKIGEQEKRIIKNFLEKGFTQREISTKMKIPKSTVAWHAKKINFKPNSKKGRHKILSERDENFVIRQISSGKTANAMQLSKELKQRFDITASRNTVARVLKKNGLKSAEK